MVELEYTNAKHLIINKLESFNWEGAFRGMRNPMNSWDKSDSKFNPLQIGEKDLDLAMKLAKNGSEHRKFMRQIFVSCDVVAPLYWWKEQETYQVGTVENSTSQMHKLGSRLLTKDDFIIDDFDKRFEDLLANINEIISAWQMDKANKKTWRKMIQIIPTSYVYTRTITLNYEVLANQYKQRKEHKLIEWHEYLYQMSKLPYSCLFIQNQSQVYLS